MTGKPHKHYPHVYQHTRENGNACGVTRAPASSRASTAPAKLVMPPMALPIRMPALAKFSCLMSEPSGDNPASMSAFLPETLGAWSIVEHKTTQSHIIQGVPKALTILSQARRHCQCAHIMYLMHLSTRFSSFFIMYGEASRVCRHILGKPCGHSATGYCILRLGAE
jgi:hypothetical protein